MMQVVSPRSWKDEFALAAAVKREDILLKEKLERFHEGERKRREEQRDRDERYDAEALDTIETALATTEAAQEFRVQLDEYDTATVEALMDNGMALDAIRARMDAMLDEAYVLPDGRRVFKTKDGTRVIDENGREVARDVIDPATIDEKKPRWETYRADANEWEQLSKQREQLLEYQVKLDEARERLDKGEITKDELEELKTELAAEMPDAVREKLGVEKPKTESAPAPKANPAEMEAAMPSNMDALMRNTGLGPAGPT